MCYFKTKNFTDTCIHNKRKDVSFEKEYKNILKKKDLYKTNIKKFRTKK